MMLPRQPLVAALLDAFDTAGFDAMLSTQLNMSRQHIIAGTGGEGLDDLVAKVVAYYDVRYGAINLIRGALAANPMAAKLNEFITTYPEWDPAKHAAPGDPLATLIIRGYRVFLKRVEFREILRNFGVPPNSRVLAIDGDRFTGKTYSQYFLHYMFETHPAWAASKNQAGCIDLDSYSNPLSPEELAYEIGKQLSLDPANKPPPSKGEQDPRRIPDLIDWLRKQVKTGPFDVSWIVLDGFRTKVQPTATHDLIRALMNAVDGDSDWARARLLLINYKTFIDSDIADFISAETISPIDRPDVEEFFHAVYGLTKKNVQPEQVTQTVNDVWGQAEKEMERRGEGPFLKYLNSGLSRAARKLLCPI